MGAPSFRVVFVLTNHYPRSREHFLIPLSPAVRHHTHPFGGLGLSDISIFGLIEGRLHKKAKLVRNALQLWQVFYDTSEHFRVRQCDGQVVIQSIVIPVHFGQTEDRLSRFVPRTVPCMASQLQWPWRAGSPLEK